MNINQYADERLYIGPEDVFDVEWYNSADGSFNTAKVAGYTMAAFIKRNMGLYAQISDGTPVVNTTIESNLVDAAGVGTMIMPSKNFEVGDSFRAVISGVISSDNNNTIEFFIRSNGTTLLAQTGLITLPQTTEQGFKFEVDFTIREIGVNGQVMSMGLFTFNKDSSNEFEGQEFRFLQTSLNTLIDNELQITAKWGTASPTNSIQSLLFNLRRTY